MANHVDDIAERLDKIAREQDSTLLARAAVFIRALPCQHQAEEGPHPKSRCTYCGVPMLLMWVTASEAVSVSPGRECGDCGHAAEDHYGSCAVARTDLEVCPCKAFA